MFLRNFFSQLLGPCHYGPRRGHGSGQSGSCLVVAAASFTAGPQGVPGSRRLLSPFYPELRNYCGAADRAAPKGGVRVVTRSDRGF